MFCVLRHHFVPRHLYPEVIGKTRNLGGKKMEFGRILFETFFCTEQHVTWQDHTKIYQPRLFFWPRHFFWESAEINAYSQVRYFFLPRGVCRYMTLLSDRAFFRWKPLLVNLPRIFEPTFGGLLSLASCPRPMPSQLHVTTSCVVTLSGRKVLVQKSKPVSGSVEFGCLARRSSPLPSGNQTGNGKSQYKWRF